MVWAAIAATFAVQFVYRIIVNAFYNMKGSSGEAKDRDLINFDAAPDLITLIDSSLFEQYEGDLHPPLSAATHLLNLFRNMVDLSNKLLQKYSSSSEILSRNYKAFGVQTRTYSEIAIDVITLDPLAASAVVVNPKGNSTSSSSGNNSLSDSLYFESSDEFLNHHHHHSHNRDEVISSWECANLICPDSNWADEVNAMGQRYIKAMNRQLSVVMMANASEGSLQTSSSVHVIHALIEKINTTVKYDLADALNQFRTAVDAKGPTLKHLYLTKCQYRTPFRAFLESHTILQSAPRFSMVENMLNAKNQGDFDKVKSESEASRNELLKMSFFMELLQYEQLCETMEWALFRLLLPFAELSRVLLAKKGNLKFASDTVEAKDVYNVDDTMNMLKVLRSVNNEDVSSTGIRQLLLHFQGLEFGVSSLKYADAKINENIDGNLRKFMRTINIICKLVQSKGGFIIGKKEIDLPQTLSEECLNFDSELFEAHYKDWFLAAQKQMSLALNPHFKKMPRILRRIEMDMGVAAASKSALVGLQEKLNNMRIDRKKRFNLLEDTIFDVCYREFDFFLKLRLPGENEVMNKPSNSDGVFSIFSR